MTFVRDYNNDQNLRIDVQKLIDHGIERDDIYILTHGDEHTKRLSNETNTGTIHLSQTTNFNQKGDELRSKLEKVGIPENASEEYEEMLDKGKILLIVTGDDDIDSVLH